MGKVFLLNPEKKNLRKFVLSCSRKTHIEFRKITSPSRRLGYSNFQLKAVNRLKDSFRLSETMVLGKRQDESAPNFFQGLRENICSLQPRPFKVFSG